MPLGGALPRPNGYLETAHLLTLKQIIFVPPAICVAAQAIGALERRGLTVTTINTRSSIQQRDGLIDGSYDVAVTAMDNVISWTRDARVPFKIIGQVERSTRLFIYSRPKFSSLADLRGARLAVDAPDSGLVLALRGAVELAGVAPGEYSLVPFGGVKERLDALTDDRADAALLGPPLDAAADAAGLRLLGEIQNFFPDYPGLGLIVRQDSLERLKTELSAYIAALNETLASVQAHSVAVTEALVAAGYVRERTQSVLGALPVSLRPDHAGIQRILALRYQFDSSMARDLGYTDIVDDRFLVADTSQVAHGADDSAVSSKRLV